ncbi:hypothetical protein BT69DRAFT_1295283 [Atractiella rhizophila]|nr:hypothetical protein BT69DRAFT_1295283 [Atractiella rhizophila]
MLINWVWEIHLITLICISFDKSLVCLQLRDWAYKCIRVMIVKNPDEGSSLAVFRLKDPGQPLLLIEMYKSEFIAPLAKYFTPEKVSAFGEEMMAGSVSGSKKDSGTRM